ncbi:MAG: class I SAM-dependent methyltransferase [Pseudomonadota bacterium]
MVTEATLALRCTSCESSPRLHCGTAEGEPGLICPDCGTRYPVFARGGQSVPWLFPVPEARHGAWGAEVKRTLDSLAQRSEQLAALGCERGLTALARIRLSRTHKGVLQQIESLQALMQDFHFDRGKAGPQQRCPSLLGYSANVFRDWCWENGETEHMLNAVVAALDEMGQAAPRRMLTLGSGSGRLSIDLHRRLKLDQSILFDINPFLMAVAATLYSGDTLRWPEFPVAPKSLEEGCVVQQLADPTAGAGADGAVHFMLGDVTALPFENESMDAVLTPWLIDVVPLPLPELLGRINALLPIGGLWLNTGSLAFDQRDATHEHFAIEEVLAMVETAGFRLRALDQSEQAYLQSPASCHRRYEQVTTFCAEKIRATPVDFVRGERQRDRRESIVRSPRIEQAAAFHLLHAQVLSAVDGQRSERDLAELLVGRYDLVPSVAEQLVQDILKPARPTGQP